LRDPFSLTIATEDYQHFLTKKKESDALRESEKFLSVDALGVVMIGHGEEFGGESAFGTQHTFPLFGWAWLDNFATGQCLVRFGRAHCKIAALQESMGITLRETFMEALNTYQDEVSEYQVQRKKLDSRRCVHSFCT
jgi:hypothetical protein